MASTGARQRIVPGLGRVLRLAILASPLVATLAGCGDDVSVCTDIGSNARSCEVCGNGRDDDRDGDVDCRDSDCDHAAVCRDENLATTASATSLTVDAMVGEVNTEPGASMPMTSPAPWNAVDDAIR